jgi:FkbM family methyltransferase
VTLARVEYRTAEATFLTPRGQLASFRYRLDTSDWNTISSVMQPHDEYGLAGIRASGLALDVGAHIGAVTIALAMDNPELHVIAVEAIGENADLAEENVARNGLSERVQIVHAAAAAKGVPSTTVMWRGQGSENAEHHAFIGNSSLVYDHMDIPHETETIGCISAASFFPDEPIALLKIDCEGCEWGFLDDPAIKRVERIVGEWHPVNGKTRRDLEVLLAATHLVTFSGPEAGPGGFVAVRA